MSEAQSGHGSPATDDGEWTDEELAAAERLADEYGDDDPLGRICERIAQADESSEEASS